MKLTKFIPMMTIACAVSFGAFAIPGPSCDEPGKYVSCGTNGVPICEATNPNKITNVESPAPINATYGHVGNGPKGATCPQGFNPTCADTTPTCTAQTGTVSGSTVTTPLTNNPTVTGGTTAAVTNDGTVSEGTTPAVTTEGTATTSGASCSDGTAPMCARKRPKCSSNTATVSCPSGSVPSCTKKAVVCTPLPQ